MSESKSVVAKVSEDQFNDIMEPGYILRKQNLELQARVQELETVIKDHVDRHCPKSYNQSACTWLHDYERLTAVLKQGEKK